MRRSVVLLSAVGLLGGCTGSLTDPSPGAGGTDDLPPGAVSPGPNKGTGKTPNGGPPGTEPAAAGPPPATASGCAKPGGLGTSPLRRLTHEEYDNTVGDLLGVTLRLSSGFVAEGEVGGLSNNVSQQGLTGALVDGYFSAAEKLSTAATENLPRLMGCDPAGAAEATCVSDFIDKLGTRAFRRPLTDAERTTFKTAYASTRKEATSTPRDGVRGVIEAMLVSPQFLFRTEAGVATGGVETLDDFSVASRLSYFLWGTMPDAALFDAARAGELRKPEQIAAQADRMLKDPRAISTRRRVYMEWLDIEALDGRNKDAKLFPAFTTKLRDSMKKEVEKLVEHVITEKQGSVEALLTSPVSFVDADLAKLYGADPVTEPKQVELRADRRGGILSRAGFLASLSGETETNLVHRGFIIRERLLCQPVLPPPPNVAKLPARDPKQTTRQRFAKHESDPTCASCHVLMDPIGLALENYDAIGAWRDAEDGHPIEDGGELTSTEKDGAFRGATGLGKALAANPTHQSCVVQVFFRTAVGRTDEGADACTMDALRARFAAGGFKTDDLLKAIVASDAFRFRPIGN